jgi:hypothetical protein
MAERGPLAATRKSVPNSSEIAADGKSGYQSRNIAFGERKRLLASRRVRQRAAANGRGGRN